MAVHQDCQLLIMRHGKSDWGQGINRDFDRPLSERGNSDARNIGMWLSRQDIATDVFISSPAVRARETAIIVSSELGVDTADVIWEPYLYEATLADLLTVIGKYSKRNRNILLIGHNPGLESLLCYLAKDEPDRTPSGKLMTTSAVAILDYGAAPVSVKPHSAHLKKLMRPRQLL
jgi:phosphohistidine phosphatase